MDSYEEVLIHIEKIQHSLSVLMRIPSVFVREEKELLISINKQIAVLKSGLGSTLSC